MRSFISILRHDHESIGSFCFRTRLTLLFGTLQQALQPVGSFAAMLPMVYDA